MECAATFSGFFLGLPTGLEGAVLVAAGALDATALRDGARLAFVATRDARPVDPTGFDAVLRVADTLTARNEVFGVARVRAAGRLDDAVREAARFGAEARAVFAVVLARGAFAPALVRVVRLLARVVIARVVVKRLLVERADLAAGLLAGLAFTLLRVDKLALAAVEREVFGVARFVAAEARTADLARAGDFGALRGLDLVDLLTLVPAPRARELARVPPRVDAVRRPPARMAIDLALFGVPLVSSLLICFTFCLSGAIRSAVDVRIGRSRFTCNLASRRPVSTKSSRYGPVQGKTIGTLSRRRMLPSLTAASSRAPGIGPPIETSVPPSARTRYSMEKPARASAA